MVLVKKKCPPERRKAIIAVSVAPSSPTLSVSSDPPQDFKLRISLRIAHTTRPGHAITIATRGTVFTGRAAAPLGDDAFDPLSEGMAGLAATTSTSDEPPGSGGRRAISLGRFRFNRARPDAPPSSDLKERPEERLLTIPAEGSVEVTHDLPLGRIFKYERNLKKEDVVGEEWRLLLNDGYVGTTWWCWGDLEGDLREKRLSWWHEGMVSWGVPKPDVDDGWVLGLNTAELVFEVQTAGSEFRFVE